jgi:DASH complex subunit DAD3
MATEDFNDRRSTTPSGEPRGSSNPLLGSSNPLISDLEQEVLDEYSRLLDNVNKVCTSLIYKERERERGDFLKLTA